MIVLNEQRKMFIDEYIKLRCKNAKQAAINAGYSQKSAQSQASQILNDPNVQEYLQQGMIMQMDGSTEARIHF